LDLECELVINLERQTSDLGRSESLLLYSDGIISGWKLRNDKDADGAGCCLLLYYLDSISDQHACRWHNGIVLINDRSTQGGRTQRRIGETGGVSKQLSILPMNSVNGE
jgi:hypothetical protein